MRIALVTPAYPPEVGGIESYVENLATALVALNHQVDVLTQTSWSPEKHGPDNAGAQGPSPLLRVLRFPDRTGTRQFRIAPGLWRHLRAHGASYDVVHAHNFHAVPALIASITAPSSFVFTPYFHGSGHTLSARLLHRPYDLLARRIFAKASFVLCLSESEMQDVGTAYPSTAGKLFKVGVGVDGEAFREALPIDVDTKQVLVLGRLEPYKNVDLALDAFSMCNVDAEMKIIGSGSQSDHLRHRISELGLSGSVQLFEHVDNHTVRRWQRTAHVAMSLSTVESFGLGVAEAALAGAHVVASDIAAHREVAEMAGGAVQLVPVNGPAREIAASLSASLVQSERPHSQCSFPTWPEVARKTAEFYERAAGRRTR
jgi:glycosyltransferase involved in cell wall biosynthesis